MIEKIVHWMISAGILYFTTNLIKGISVKSYPSAMWASLVIGFFNIWLRPILIILTLPINILTIGLFTFVVNAIILRITAWMLSGFKIYGWMAAVKSAVVMALLNMIIYKFI